MRTSINAAAAASTSDHEIAQGTSGNRRIHSRCSLFCSSYGKCDMMEDRGGRLRFIYKRRRGMSSGSKLM